MAISFLQDLESIFEFLLRRSDAKTTITTLYDEIKEMTEEQITQRDVENFVAYFEVILSAPKVPKKVRFNRELVKAFIGRTYTGMHNSALENRVDSVYDYLQSEIEDNTEITHEGLKKILADLNESKKPSLEKIMARARIATILKWLQGPLKEQLSLELQDNVVFLATVYGQHKKNIAINVDWQTYKVTKEDMEILDSEYRMLEIAIIEAFEDIKAAREKLTESSTYQDQFQIVLTSFDNLVMFEESGILDSFDSFKDKLIISITLIYLQDEYVKKDPELKKLIQLFVSMYVKFRDAHYGTDSKIETAGYQ
ncbi:MAG: hypothetical protein OEV79_10065 [candidate division WOR-3 bacterium]|nr:hypothetical protein [candidate division WOR-3 bacterium]